MPSEGHLFASATVHDHYIVAQPLLELVIVCVLVGPFFFGWCVLDFAGTQINSSVFFFMKRRGWCNVVILITITDNSPHTRPRLCVVSLTRMHIPFALASNAQLS